MEVTRSTQEIQAKFLNCFVVGDESTLKVEVGDIIFSTKPSSGSLAEPYLVVNETPIMNKPLYVSIMSNGAPYEGSYFQPGTRLFAYPRNMVSKVHQAVLNIFFPKQ